jgi:molecular chaperone HscB
LLKIEEEAVGSRKLKSATMATSKPQSAIPVLPNGDAEPHSCWSCGDMRAAQFCRSCGSVQPPAPTDYFSFFGLPRAMNIEPSLLEKHMFALSRRLHPDLYSHASVQEQDWSLEQTSKLNNAYRTLRDPVLRTEYLLRLEGVRTTDRAAKNEAAPAGPLRAAPPDLLEEVFELNLQLEEYRGGERDAALRLELQQSKAKLEAKLQAVGAELQSCWNTWDQLLERDEQWPETAAPGERRRVLEQMLGVLHRRRYLDHLIRETTATLGE